MSRTSFREFHKKVVANNSLTQDMPVLTEHENQYVFVYGTLKQGGSRGLLNPRDKVGYGRTLVPMYEMRCYSPGMFPTVTRALVTEDAGYINGEIYLLNTDAMPTLDRIESNGYLYVRKPTRIWSYGTQEAITCWMYETIPHAFKLDYLTSENISSTKMNSYKMYNWMVGAL